jgi:hypothetical protein
MTSGQQARLGEPTQLSDNQNRPDIAAGGATRWALFFRKAIASPVVFQ